MDRDFLIQLTNNLYRLTLLFPKKEPLRYKMRELADEILANLILVNSADSNPFFNHKDNFNENSSCYDSILENLENLEILDSFFEVAKTQNWVSPFDALSLQEEYIKIKKELLKLAVSDTASVNTDNNLAVSNSDRMDTDRLDIAALAAPVEQKERTKLEKNPRQEKILEILKEKGRAQVWEFKKIFPQVTKRTLRRDFEYLLRQGLIERIGERNETFYLPCQSASSELKQARTGELTKGVGHKYI